MPGLPSDDVHRALLQLALDGTKQNEERLTSVILGGRGEGGGGRKEGSIERKGGWREGKWGGAIHVISPLLLYYPRAEEKWRENRIERRGERGRIRQSPPPSKHTCIIPPTIWGKRV